MKEQSPITSEAVKETTELAEAERDGDLVILIIRHQHTNAILVNIRRIDESVRGSLNFLVREQIR